jgi:hypothetical protein
MTETGSSILERAIEATGDVGAVHYLPILSTVISAAFLVSLCSYGARRGWPPHLAWWTIGVLCYGLGTALESWITLFGNTPALNQSWYWAGAILGGYPLATGTVYLLLPRRAANIATSLSGAVVVFATFAVFLTPLNTGAVDAHRPSGDIIGWTWVRALTPLINGYAAFFLVGGAIYSTVRFATTRRDGRRATGTALIALGGILPGVGGGFAKAGLVEALYVGELLGIILIWAGYALCTSRFKSRVQGDARAGVLAPTHGEPT